MNTKERLRAEAVLHGYLEMVDGWYQTARERAHEAMVADGAKVMTPVLEDGTKLGTTSMTTSKAKAKVTDAEAFLAWVMTAYPDEITRRMVSEVRPAFAKKLLADMASAGAAVDPATGEAVPGVLFVEEHTSGHSVRLSEEGRARIRSEIERTLGGGELAAGVRLELPAGGAS